MKITHVTSEVFKWDRPAIWNGNHLYGPGRLHKVTVYTDEGVTGVGWNGGTAAERPLGLMPGYVDYFRPLLIGRDPLDTVGIVDALGKNQIKILGPAGLNTQVLAAINIACWDIRGKAEGRSVHSLLGGAQKRIRTYIAGGYYAEGKGLAELQDELRYNVEELHSTAVKIKIGDPVAGFDLDMKRVEASRDAIGPDVVLMVDANCALDLETSLRFASALEEYDVYWFEEPMPIHDYEGHRQLAEATSIKIATGENGYTTAHFQTLLEHNGASILNVDVTICPGYDVGLEIANMGRGQRRDHSPPRLPGAAAPPRRRSRPRRVPGVLPHRGRPAPGRDVPAKTRARRGRLRHRPRPPRRRLRAKHGPAGPLQGLLITGQPPTPSSLP